MIGLYLRCMKGRNHMSDLLILIAVSLPLGALAGFAAGLFGIGGGAVIVPVLYYVFTHLGYYGDAAMQAAVATSLLTIVPTGFVSSYTHYKHDAIDFSWFKLLLVGIVIGAVFGGLSAIALPGDVLKRIFGGILLVMAFLMFKSKANTSGVHKEINKILAAGFGLFSGVISALMGIGGATLNVPFMVQQGAAINRAIATASALGVCVAVSGSLVFLFNDVNGNGDVLTPYSVGYVNFVSVLSIISLSMFTAKKGAKLTHKMDAQKLKKIFAIFMMLVALKMLF